MPVGFASLPNQRHKIISRKGATFTLLVVGPTGAGKTTFINTLFSSVIKEQKSIERTSTEIERSVSIVLVRADIEEQGFHCRLNVVDTPGFGDYMNNTDCWLPIIEFIDEQHFQSMKYEQQKDRNSKNDLRVHACLYFISPTGQTLSALDIKVMKELGQRVNLIPVIAKGDTMTKSATIAFKKNIRDVIEFHDIKVYQPENDDDDDLAHTLMDALPYTIISSEKKYNVGGNPTLGREYLWGVAEVENPDHCDFVHLRNLLIRTHMYDLIDKTDDLYEDFKTQKMQSDGFDEKTFASSQLDASAMKQAEELLRKKFTEQVRIEETRFRKWENNLIEERARLNKDLEAAHKIVKDLNLEIEELENSLRQETK